jgi:Rad3-related DNA helicase
MKDICLQKLEQIDRSRIDIEKTRRGIDPTKEKEELENLKERRKDLEEKEEKIQNLLDKIKIIENLDEEFVVEEKDESDRVDGVVLKPIYCGDFFEKKIAPMSEKFLLSSATFSNAKKTLEMLGVDRSEVKVISIPSNFPVENRPVHFKDVTSLKYSDKKRGDIGDISTSILNIMQKHNDDKGIVHCGSYSRQRKIIQQLENLGASDRVIEHESSNSEEKFKQFKEAEDNSVLISVAKEEGVDLRQDDARFNVLVKTPNPNTEDIRVNYRINENEEWEWYFNQTAIRVAQCYGRTTRSKDDWSDFYILDSYFQEFYQRNRHLLPQWFIEAAESSSLSAEGRT